MSKKNLSHKRQLSDHFVYKQTPTKLFNQYSSKEKLLTQFQRKSSQLRKSHSKKLSKIIVNQNANNNNINNNNPVTYDTYQRVTITNQSPEYLQLIQLRKIVSQCQNCKKKLGVCFSTKKPIDFYRDQLKKMKVDKQIQTQTNMNIFLKLQQKIDQIRNINRLQMQKLWQKDQVIQNMESEIIQIDQKVKHGIFQIHSQIFLFQRFQQQNAHLKHYIKSSIDSPSFLKAMSMESNVKNFYKQDI